MDEYKNDDQQNTLNATDKNAKKIDFKFENPDFIDESLVVDAIKFIFSSILETEQINDEVLSALHCLQAYVQQKDFKMPDLLLDSNFITVICRLLTIQGEPSEISIEILCNIWYAIKPRQYELFYDEEILDKLIIILREGEIPVKIHVMHALANCFQNSPNSASYIASQPDYFNVLSDLFSIDHFSLRNEILVQFYFIIQNGFHEFVLQFISPCLDLISSNIPVTSKNTSNVVNALIRKDTKIAGKIEHFFERLLNGMYLGFTDTLIICIDTICTIVLNQSNEIDLTPLYSAAFLNSINTAIMKKLIDDSSKIYNLLAALSPQIDPLCLEYGIIDQAFEHLNYVSFQNKVVILCYLITFFHNAPDEIREQIAYNLFENLLQTLDGLEIKELTLFLQTMIKINPDNHFEDLSEEWLDALDDLTEHENDTISFTATQYLEQFEP